MQVKSETIKYDEDDEHILRRLGGAVVLQWDKLAPEAQKLILDQANFVHDRHQTVQLRQQLGSFIKGHKL